MSLMILLAGGALPAFVAWQRPSVSAADDEQSNLAKFMRKKLNASSLILEGLTIEDAGLIKEGSKEILEMSRSELWNVLLDEDYREFNREFRSSMRKLEKAAEDENFDNALLQWTDAVKGCVECHKHVRSQRTKIKS
jgi:hypothetical protein